MNIKELMTNKKFRGFLTSLYSLGASVVVLGALFKIQHWRFADVMLTLGLVTEAMIFFLYAFEPNDDTTPVQGANLLPGANGFHLLNADGTETGARTLTKLDRLMDDAEFTPELFFKLGEGMKKLTEATENINTMGDISVASVRYLKTIKKVDESLEKTAKDYESVISNVTTKTEFKYKSISGALQNIEKGSTDFHQQLGLINKNITDLNSIYKLQQESAKVFLKEQTECAEESRKYKEHMIQLNENLKAMNQFYGNMLAAMRTK